VQVQLFKHAFSHSALLILMPTQSAFDVSGTFKPATTNLSPFPHIEYPSWFLTHPSEPFLRYQSL
jgi:hypothetical protein